jgi:hypothetical protein
MLNRLIWKLLIVLVTIILISVAAVTVMGNASAVSVNDDVEPVDNGFGTDDGSDSGETYAVNDELDFATMPVLQDDSGVYSDDSLQHMAPTWPAPSVKQVFGDDFSERAIFVHQDDATYLDDLLFTAAIPAAVYWEGSTRYDCMMISDDKIRENGNLLGDYAEYLRQIEATPDIDFIGPVPATRQAELSSYFQNVDQSNAVTTSTNVYSGACDIAQYYWGNRRQLGTDTAVLSFVPDANGGTEVKLDHKNFATGPSTMDATLDAEETSWIYYSINWSDPGADTDYRVSIDDPIVLHQSEYSNSAAVGHVNPTNNKLFDNMGNMGVGVSPYYSYMPYSVDSNPQSYQYQTFTGTLPAADLSYYPTANGTDHMTFQFGPVKKGEWIGVGTNWTYYNFNETIFRDFNTYIYAPGQPVGPDNHLEVRSDNPFDPMMTRGTPEFGYVYADKAGYYNVTVHPFVLSVGGSFTTTVYWGGVGSTATWKGKQVNPGNDQFEYNLKEYGYYPDAVAESVTNGATVASLKNIPLLYTAGGTPETGVVQALKDLGITNLIIIDPNNNISATGWETSGFTVEHVSTDIDVFNYIYDINKAKDLHKGMILTPLGGPWFTSAALAGAYHGVPVPYMNDAEGIDVQIKATALWWQNIQNTCNFDSYPATDYAAPSQTNMRELADMFYGWIEDFNTDYNPDCGDADGDGAPDNGINWDYSEDVEVLVVSPMNAIKATLDRAISGKASVGRLTPSQPEVLWAVMNREMLYWKAGYSQADNPENPNDSPPVKDHWKRICWSLNTYAHDDGLADNDAGDADDDDYCWYDDGGAVHTHYKSREDLPAYADASGRVNLFNTYYDNIRDAMEDGVALWSNHGHGHAYWMLETGIGFTGTSTNPSNPKWGLPVPDNGFVDPPLETTTGLDWYYDIDNVHGAFTTYQSCQTGGSAMQEYFMRLGGIAAIGGYVTRSLNEATVQSDRTYRGMMLYNMTFGDAHRWGQDEAGPMFSTKDTGPYMFNFTDAGYTDVGVQYKKGNTGHTILYGDPSLLFIAPTLWTLTDIYVDEAGQNLVVDITVMDQSGVKMDPATLIAKLDGVPLTLTNTGVGLYSALWPVITAPADHIITVDLQHDDYLDPLTGTTHFQKTYNIHIPEIEVTPGNLTYTGDLQQTVAFSGTAGLPEMGGQVLGETDVNTVNVLVYNSNDNYVDLQGEMTWDEMAWIITDLNVSSLPEGDYYVMMEVNAKHHIPASVKGPSFTVEHRLYFQGGDLVLGGGGRTLALSDLAIVSTFAGHGILSDSDISTGTCEVFRSDTRAGESTGISGDLEYDSGTETFGFQCDVSGLAQGTYHCGVEASTAYTSPWTWTSEEFIIETTLHVSAFTVTYTGNTVQTLDISEIGLGLTSDTESSPLPSGQVTTASYTIYDSDDKDTGVTGPLTETSGMWGATATVVCGGPQQ